MRIRRPYLIPEGQHGFAVPTVMFMLLAAFAVVTVGVVASIQAQGGTVRDQRSKSALTAAEAGVGQALLSYNGGFSPSDAFPCRGPASNPPNTVQPLATQPDGWGASVGPIT